MEGTMTKTESLRAMKAGAILTHKYFGEREYIQNNGNFDFLLSGRHSVPIKSFFNLRNDSSWGTGWSTYTGELHGEG